MLLEMFQHDIPTKQTANSSTSLEPPKVQPLSNVLRLSSLQEEVLTDPIDSLEKVSLGSSYDIDVI